MKLVIGEFRWIFGGSSTSGNVLTSRELQIQQSPVKRFFPFTFELWRVQVLYQENNGSVTTDESRNRQTGNTNRIRYYSSRKTFLMWCIRFGMPRFTSEISGHGIQSQLFTIKSINLSYFCFHTGSFRRQRNNTWPTPRWPATRETTLFVQRERTKTRPKIKS